LDSAKCHENGDGRWQDKLEEIEEPASPTLAFKQLCLACLRLFPGLQDALPPREDWPEDNFKPAINMGCIAYIGHLPYEVGFRTSKIEAFRHQPQDNGPTIPCLWPEIPDWRGGRPFTRTFWYLRHSGFLPKLLDTKRRLARYDDGILWKTFFQA
jgi:hypothetical protein